MNWHEIFEYRDGKIPTGLSIDHINHVKDDNRIENLRLVTQQEKDKNKPMKACNKSGFTGVSFDKQRNKWVAQITPAASGNYIGIFDTIEEAIAARKAANIKYGFHENHGSE